MTVHLITVSLAILLIAVPLLQLDFPTLLGEVWSSGALERWAVRIFLPLAIAGGLALSFADGDSVRNGLSAIYPYEGSASILAVALSCVVAVMVTGMISRYSSLPYAFVGTLFGCRLMAEGSLDLRLTAEVAASWLAAPLLCALLAAGFAALTSSRGSRARNLIKADTVMVSLCTVASVVFAGAFAWNNGAIVSVFTRGLGDNPWTPFSAVLTVLILIFVLLLGSIRSEGWRIADIELDIPVSSVFSVMAASAITLIIFSTPLPSFVHLSSVPLSVSALLVASLFSVSLVNGRPAMEGERMTKSIVATAAAPVLGLLISYCICVILNASPSGSRVTPLRSDPTPLLILLGIIILASSLVVYVRSQRNRELRKQIIESREQQAYAAHKSLADIEIKAEMNEKDLLNKLEIKRKELVDFAVGISEQKAFMETVFSDLKDIRNTAGVQEKDRAIDILLKSIRDRMYFSREMNDFYAQTEILHKDFNMRLGEAYPNLTESERKLANLLRQGFSSKHIASLMNITPKSVEISRYRLRSKLGLQRSDNLIKFIKSI